MKHRFEHTLGYSRTRNTLIATGLAASAGFLTTCGNESLATSDFETENRRATVELDSASDLILDQLIECDHTENNPNNFITDKDIANGVQRFESLNRLSDASSIVLDETYQVPIYCDANAASIEE